MVKKILNFVLILAIVLSVGTFPAFAEETSTEETIDADVVTFSTTMKVTDWGETAPFLYRRLNKYTCLFGNNKCHMGNNIVFTFKCISLKNICGMDSIFFCYIP